MPTVDDVQFDTTGWELRERQECRVLWGNSHGDVLSKRYSPGTPKTPGPFRVQALKNYLYDQIASIAGAVISLDLLQVKGVAVTKLVYKVAQPQDRFGYVGTLSIAYRDFSYTIKLQTLERSGDEARGLHVWNQLQESYPPETDLSSLWFEPVSNHLSHSPVLRCRADNEIWDHSFPDHPLSRLRFELIRIVPSLAVDRMVKNSVPHRS